MNTYLGALTIAAMLASTPAAFAQDATEETTAEIATEQAAPAADAAAEDAAPAADAAPAEDAPAEGL
ncbi:hypothetical protein, partial [Primorskyibacter sedentarius]|uniref:hypothetical protein n=1 Tax=Primorskyibacter sedentarius TaxID=745311 RepID=UPI003EB73FA5